MVLAIERKGKFLVASEGCLEVHHALRFLEQHLVVRTLSILIAKDCRLVATGLYSDIDRWGRALSSSRARSPGEADQLLQLLQADAMSMINVRAATL